MRVDTSGNVGIGVTSTSGSKLFINGAALNDLTTFSTADAATTLLNNDNGAALGRATKVLFRNGNLNLAGIAGVYTGFNGAGDIAGALAFGTQTNVAGGITERMRIDSSGNVGIGTSSPVVPLDVVSPSNAIGAQIRGRTSDNISILRFVNNVSNVEYARIQAQSDAVSINAVVNGPLIMATNNAERARIDSSGNLLVGTTSQIGVVTARGVFSSAANLLALQAGNGNVGAYMTNNSGTGNWQPFSFCNNGSSFTQIGSITTTASATAYNTSSDYRLKEDVQPMTGALARVAALKPVTYKWKVDGSDGEGFIAHELAEVVPDAVTGEKDAVNEDGSIKPQGIDTSFLVATLTAAIQELKAELDATKAKVAALENA